MNRRGFVISGISAAGMLTSALPAVPASSPAPAMVAPAGIPALFGVVFDRRFEAARLFGRAAAWRGHMAFGYDGDLTATWLHQLEPRWSRRAGALAGMTTPAALFCLEQLAAQHWLRVVRRTGHAARRGQALVSWVIA
jgi:hypothetical protein